MPREKNRTLEMAAKELEEHFAKTTTVPPDGRIAVKFDIHQRGSLALIQLPYLRTSVEFGIACRAIKMDAETCAVKCLFFDRDQALESFQGDNDFYLRKLGLQRIPAGT